MTTEVAPYERSESESDDLMERKVTEAECYLEKSLKSTGKRIQGSQTNSQHLSTPRSRFLDSNRDHSVTAFENTFWATALDIAVTIG